MKKLFLSIGLVLVASAALAGSWKSFPIFTGNPTSVIVTNLIGITNLLTASANSTNMAGTTFTNASGTQVVDTTGSTGNLLGDYIPFPRYTDGTPMYRAISNAMTGDFRSDFDLVVKVTGGSGANAAQGLTLVFTPVTGKGADTEGVTGATADEWWVGITPTTSTTLTVITNVPMHRWPGAAGLRCRRIFNTDTDASAQVWITECSINGWVP